MLFPVVFAPTHAFRMMKFLARKLPLSPVSDVDFQEILSSPMTIPVIHSPDPRRVFKGSNRKSSVLNFGLDLNTFLSEPGIKGT